MKLLKFEQPHCIPCAAVQKYLDGNGVPYESIDASQDFEQAVKWKISSVPTLILLDESGSEVQRVMGFDRAKVADIASKVASV